MADDKIIQEVELRGGDKVEKDLQSIGKVGEQTFNRLAQAAEKVGELAIPTEQIEQNITDVREAGKELVTTFQQVQTAGEESAQGIATS